MDHSVSTKGTPTFSIWMLTACEASGLLAEVKKQAGLANLPAEVVVFR
jgi:hypothetical protein